MQRQFLNSDRGPLGTFASRVGAIMAMAGLLLGPESILIALFVAMVLGAVLGLMIWAVTKDREIPFGPFLALGVLAVLYHGAAVSHFIFVEWPAWWRLEG